MTPIRSVSVWLAASASVCAAGCSATLYLLGGGGVLGDGGGPPAVTNQPSSGGLGGPSNSLPTTTPPAPVSGPVYRVALLDDLREQTAGPTMVIATDLDNDGRPDLAAISSESQVVQVFLRNPATQRFEQFTVAGGGPLAKMVKLAAGDFDGDGRTDLAVAVRDTGFAPTPPASLVSQIVLIFAPADPRDQIGWVTVPLTFSLRQCDENAITDLAAADFDGVNGPDIAFVSNEPPPAGSNTPRRYIFLFQNPGPAQARNPLAWGVPRPGVLGLLPPFVEVDAPIAGQVFAADIDGDGDADLVATLSPAKSFNVRWLENPGGALIDPDPTQALPRWARRFVGQQEQGANVAAVGDIDGDGDIDVAVATNVPSPLVQWFRNPGPALVSVQTFPWEVFNIGIPTGSPINQLALADLDNDGRLDAWVGAGPFMSGFFPRSGVNFLDYWSPFIIAESNPPATIGAPAFVDLSGNGRTDFVVPLDRVGLNRDQFAIFSRP